MQKFREISNFSNVKTFPNIKAHVDMDNWKVVEVDQINKVTSWATATTASKDLCVIMQNFWNRTGDLYFGDRTLHQDDFVLCIGLESLATRFLDVGASHITGGLDGAGALTVVPGDNLIPDGTGNWVVGAAPASGTYLTVTGVTTLPTYTPPASAVTVPYMTEPAVIAQIVSV